MAYYYSRIQQDLDRSTRYAEEAQLQIRRSRRVQELLDRQQDIRRLATAEKLRADRQYEQYLLRRQTQQQQLEAQFLRQRAIRQQQLRDQQIILQAERRSRIIRQEQIQRQRIIQLAQEKKRADFLAASRKIQLDAKMKIQDQLTRQNILIRQQQLQQQKLEAQLKNIDIQIGTIYDQRQARRKAQLLQLQVLDEKIFKIKQEMRGSKIKQTALQDSLNQLSKIIVPGSK